MWAVTSEKSLCERIVSTILFNSNSFVCRISYPIAELLREIDFKDVLNNLSARRILLRIYFEKNEFQALSSLLDSFSVYLNRQKEIGYHKSSYVLLIKFVRKLLNTNLKDTSKRKEIIREINDSEMFPEKDWILEQLSRNS